MTICPAYCPGLTILPEIAGAVNPGAGAPGLTAAAPTAAARSTGSNAVAARATNMVMAAMSLPIIHLRSGSDFAECIEHARRGENLRQDNRFTLAAVEEIERDAAADELLEESGDLGVLAGPIAFERNDATRGEGMAHRVAVEGDPFIDQAGDAP